MRHRALPANCIEGLFADYRDIEESRELCTDEDGRAVWELPITD